MSANTKFYIETYGCQMNEYDSAKLASLLEKELGASQTWQIENADLVILNTCAVRGKAQQKIFSRLGILCKLKKAKPKLVIAVGGCIAAQEKKAIFRRAPWVSIIFGPQTWQRLPKIYRETLSRPSKTLDLDFASKEKFSCLEDLTSAHTSSCPLDKAKIASAYVSIMEGCNKFCSYCVVPYTRGREVSRDFDEVMHEVQNLSQQGTKEIIFLGQNVNSYRCPIAGNKNKTATLADLVRATAEISAISRIRFLTSHPAHFSADFIELYKDASKLAGHLHLPIQSGSNNILKAMRRGYTREEYIEIIQTLRKVRTNISISTDFIVGFPQESDADFEDTLSLAREIGFDNSFSFIYSQRPFTPAAKLADDIQMPIKKQRLDILQKTLRASADAISNDMLGCYQKVIVTGFAKKDGDVKVTASKTKAFELCGRTENNRIVNFSGGKELLGQEVAIKIIRVLRNSLRGEVGADI